MNLHVNNLKGFFVDGCRDRFSVCMFCAKLVEHAKYGQHGYISFSLCYTLSLRQSIAFSKSQRTAPVGAEGDITY
jgi:hypothetical protein